MSTAVNILDKMQIMVKMSEINILIYSLDYT
jgi:hypothetical protein